MDSVQIKYNNTYMSWESEEKVKRPPVLVGYSIKQVGLILNSS
jgi:hypothetical protein